MSKSELDTSTSSEISEIFLPQEYWVPSNDIKHCYNCKATFNLLTRKSHCRMCGNVFDAKCVNNFLSPPTYIFQKETKIRICDECNGKVKTLSTQGQGRGPLKRGSSMLQRLSSSRLLEIESIISDHLLTQLSDLSDEVLAHLLKENNCYDAWFEVLKPIIKDSMELAESVTLKYDKINIKNFVKIKKIPFRDTSLTKVINGLVIRKNVLNKKMSTSFPNPTILMIRGSIEQHHTNEVSFFDSGSLNKEAAYFDNITNKILELDPSIIIVEGTVNRVVQNRLAKEGKTLIVRLRESQFSKISQYTGTVPLDSVDWLWRLNKTALGKCGKFNIEDYSNKDFYQEVKPEEFSENFDNSLMFLEGCEVQRGVSIILSGPSNQELQKVKKIVQETLHIVRNLYLERGMISQDVLLYHTKERLWRILPDLEELVENDADADIRESLSLEYYQSIGFTELSTVSCLLNQITVASTGFTLKYLTERIPLKKVLKRPQLTFAKLSLVPSNGVFLNDLANRNLDVRQVVDLALESSKVVYKSELCDMHKLPKVTKITFSDKDDVTLGVFLVRKALKVFEKCASCNQRHLDHINLFFIGQFTISIVQELKPGSKLLNLKKYNWLAKPRKTVQENQIPEKKQTGFFNFLTNIVSTNTKEVKSQKNNAQDRENYLDWETAIDIILYIECSMCCTRLSDPIKLKKSYLNFSFARYMENLTNTSEQYLEYLINEEVYAKNFGDESPKKKMLKKSQSLKPCCYSSRKNRVFVIDGLLIKFQVGFSKPCMVSILDLTNPKTLLKCQEAEEKLIQKKKTLLFETQKNYLGLLLVFLNESLQGFFVKNQVEVSLKNLQLIDAALNTQSTVQKDPQNLFILGLLQVFKEVFKMREKVEVEMKKKLNSHLEVDIISREFYHKLKDLFATVTQHKKIFIESSTANGNQAKPRETIGNLESMKTEEDLPVGREKSFSIKDAFEFNNMQLSPRLQEEDDIPERKGTMKIFEVDLTKKPEIHHIENENIYIKTLTDGANLYIEDQDIHKHIKHKCVPVFEEYPLSMMAYALNSPQYMKNIYLPEDFTSYEKFTKMGTQSRTVPEYKKFMQSKFLVDNWESIQPFQVNIPGVEVLFKYFSRLLREFLKEEPKAPVQQIQKIPEADVFDIVGVIELGNNLAKRNNTVIERLVTPKFQVLIYYPVQFEALRQYTGLSLSGFISSLACSKGWEENSGGQTKATFIMSFDQRFVFKEVNKKEFEMLLGFIDKYFHYMWKVCGENQPSLLAKIYGIFGVQNEKKQTTYYIAMENLMFGAEEGCKIYDLKGSELNRYTKQRTNENKTLLDTNFKLERNSQPIPIKMKYFETVDQAIKNDTEFLCSLRVMDYSLLLIHDEESDVLKMGIIDYLHLYDLEKHLEHVGKKIIKGATPTVTKPEDYKERFQKAMTKYFMPVPCD